MDKLKQNAIQLFNEVHSKYFSTTEHPHNEETNSYEWGVEYEPDLDKIYKHVVDTIRELEVAYKSYNDPKLKDIITIGKSLRKKIFNFKNNLHKIKEESSTSQGGASFSPGSGEQYATPFSFGKKSKPTKFYYKIGYKRVPDTIPGSGLEVKELFEDQPLHELNDFQKERIAAFDDIEAYLNRLYPLVSNVKNETAEYYDANPGSYEIYKSTEMILSYLKAIETLLTAPK